MVYLDVVRHVAFGELARHNHDLELLRGILHFDHVAGFDEKARDVDAATVHFHVTVIDELAGGKRRRHELGPIDDRIETTLEKSDQVLAGIAAETDRLRVVARELLLGDVGVEALELLLGAKLRPEIGHLAFAALAVLSRSVLAAVHGALRAAPNVLSHAAVKLVLGLNALRHRDSSVVERFSEERALLFPSGTTASRRGCVKMDARPLRGPRERQSLRPTPAESQPNRGHAGLVG